MATREDVLAELQRRGLGQQQTPTQPAQAQQQATMRDVQAEIQRRQLQPQVQQPPQPQALQPGLIDESQFNQQAGSQQQVLGIGGQDGLGLSDNRDSFAGAGVIEPALTLASGVIAEPIAGLAGIGAGLLPGPPGQAARAVEATRQALTVQPVTQAGREGLQAVGEALAPVGEAFQVAEKALGDATFEATGSPAAAAFAATLPTLATELFGVAAGKVFAKTAKTVKTNRAKGLIAREITEAVPSIDQLKDTTRAIYKEIDEAGAVVKSDALDSLSRQIQDVTKSAGIDPTITPKATAAVKRFQDIEGTTPTVTELDTLRQVAQGAASSIEPKEAMLGSRIIETIDQFLDKAGPDVLQGGETSAKFGKKYKAARELWGRARRSELLQESFEKARNQASGFENGVRTQFRAILNNKKKRRFFKKDEIEAMNRVVRGTKKENFAKLVGRLGFSEGGATNILGGAVGVGAGASVAGAPGAVIVPLIGQVSRKLAQRMTVKNAEFADQVIRAGKDAKKITNAYLRKTPKSQRSSAELSELLMKTDIDLTNLPDTEIVNTARQITIENRAKLAGAIAPQLAPQEEQ